jgi:hypothetical protein
VEEERPGCASNSGPHRLWGPDVLAQVTPLVTIFDGTLARIPIGEDDAALAARSCGANGET